ncbi:MAG: InlB B-repeat-containing protein [Clostridia bacterium]|nr:InlB B-repeat-containing protein [Clostridia bacterium]
MGANTLLKVNNFFQNIWGYVLNAYEFLKAHYVYNMQAYFKISNPIDFLYVLIGVVAFIVLLIAIIVLVSVFKKKKVIFYSEGKKYLVTKCKHKGEIIFPSEIKKAGKKFLYWCTDKDLRKEFLQTTLNKNKKLKLYAKFEPVYERVDIKLPEIEPIVDTVEIESVNANEPIKEEEKVFDIGELYDAIRYEMLSYERAVPFKQLGIVRKQIVAEMFEKNGKINLYFAIDPNLMREKGYNVMDYTEPEFKIVPCKKVVDSFDDYDEVVSIIKETMLLNNFVKSNVVMATKVKSDENVRKSGFAFYVKNDIIATSAKEYYILLRSVVLSYKMSAIRKHSDSNENNMILKIFKKGEKVFLYLALNPEMEGLEFVGYDKNFLDTPAMFEINTADDCIKAQILIDKLMYRYGMEKYPDQTEIDLNEELEANCGFGYKIRR